MIVNTNHIRVGFGGKKFVQSNLYSIVRSEGYVHRQYSQCDQLTAKHKKPCVSKETMLKSNAQFSACKHLFIYSKTHFQKPQFESLIQFRGHVLKKEKKKVKANGPMIYFNRLRQQFYFNQE